MGESVSLFDLFKEHAEFSLSDERGRETKVILRSLDVFENQQATKRVESVRLEATKRLDTDDMRKTMLRSLDLLKSAQLVDQLIGMERPAAEDNEDLAPPPPPSEGAETAGDKSTEADQATRDQASQDEASKDQEATKAKLTRWEKDRRAELVAMSDDDLKNLLVNLQIRALIGMEVVTRYTEEQLVRMVVDRESRPVFSLDYACPHHPGKSGADGDVCATCQAPLQPAVNHLSRLHQKTRDELMRLRRDFLAGKSEKSLRAVVTAPPFSPSGVSGAVPDAIPGGTIETPPTSPTG